MIMTNNKKTYQQPKMKVVEIDQADIIASSNVNALAEFEEYDEVTL